MGGDSFFPSISSSGEESLLGHDVRCQSVKSGVFSTDEEHLSCKLENDLVLSGESGSTAGEVCRISPVSEAIERQKVKIYADVLRSYEEMQSQIDRLEEAKSRILSYRPGSWAEKAGEVDLIEYSVPSITSLLLVGPRSSGKSSLVNKVSQVLEDHVFASGRAPVSYNPSAGEGTYFLHEYVIPRGSGSFCLYDARSLSDDSSENMKMLKRWMTKGVRHGVLVTRKSDGVDLKSILKSKDRSRYSSSELRAVSFVIFVVNGLSVLESMDGDDEKKQQYSQMIATNFNNPLLSFKDDKPVVVVTHGDLLPLSERVRIRVYLGKQLGIPPTGQIFDIPENDDPATKLAIVDMLAYCLDRADRNLPSKNSIAIKVPSFFYLLVWMFMWMAIAILLQCFPRTINTRAPASPPPETKTDWHKIRHLWLG